MICTFKVIDYYCLICVETFEANILKYLNLILFPFLSAPGLAWQEYLKKMKYN